MQHCLILGGGLSGKAAERLAVSLGFSAAVLSDSRGWTPTPPSLRPILSSRVPA
ncbi:MAG: hypothetical protein V8T86_11460 [Victivallis sp.]